MKQLVLPLYAPAWVAPERAVLSILGAALRVARVALHDEHPSIDHAPRLDQSHAPVVVVTAKLIADRCAELAELIDFYDTTVDDVLCNDDQTIPF